jgi:hypothetical protein
MPSTLRSGPQVRLGGLEAIHAWWRRPCGLTTPMHACLSTHALVAGVLVVYILCLVVGFIINKGIAEAWVREFAKAGKVVSNNFSYTGPGGGMGLMRNSASNFTLYARWASAA